MEAQRARRFVERMALLGEFHACLSPVFISDLPKSDWTSDFPCVLCIHAHTGHGVRSSGRYVLRRNDRQRLCCGHGGGSAVSYDSKGSERDARGGYLPYPGRDLPRDCHAGPFRFDWGADHFRSVSERACDHLGSRYRVGIYSVSAEHIQSSHALEYG